MRMLPVLIVGATVSLLAQTAAGPTFDVVSIKRAQPDARVFGGNQQRPDGGFTMTNGPVNALISRGYAYSFIEGLPSWATTERYDVSATSTLTQATADDRAAMMRAMLADRFKLVAHFEPREQSVFDLVLAREDKRLGAGLTKIDTDCAAVNAERAAEAARTGKPPATPDQMRDFKAPPPPCFLRTIDATMRDRMGDGQGKLGGLMEGEVTMDGLAMALRMSAGRIVVDKTGLPGSYRVRMNFDSRPPRLGPDVAPVDGADAIPTVFTAVREQLGLKLESVKVMRETLVIDRLERPTEN